MLTTPTKGHYLAEWRKARGLSLERVVERLESEPGGKPIIGKSSLNRIERGTQEYTERVLHGLSHAYDVPVPDLLSVNPLQDAQVIDLLAILRALPADKVATATRLLKAIA